MPNPYDPKNLARLRRAIDSSRYRLEPFRRRHKEAMEQYVGVYYSDNGAERPVHMNLMEIATNIYERQLIARPPKVNILTRQKRLKPTSAKLESVMNALLETTTLHRELARAVKSALYSIGIIKVGRKYSGTFEYEGEEFARTVPIAQHVLLDDWVHDMSALNIEECSFMGHRYRMPLSVAKENEDFDKVERERLQKMETGQFNPGGDERISTISQQNSILEDEYDPKVELWEIWIPRSKLLVTLSPIEDAKPLRVVEWDGPEHGPFHMLFFNEVDGNSMPLAPAMLWQGLHRIVNSMYRKLERQAARQKTVGLARGVDTEDAERVRRASDGEVVPINGGLPIEEVSMGGIDQNTFAFMLQSKEMFSWLSGNLDALGGLGPQSETVGQDRLMFASANQRVSGMQDAVQIFVKQVLTDWGFYLWQDPIEAYPATLKLDGLEDLPSELTAQERNDAAYYDMMLEIEPYSMQFKSPGERLATLNQIVSGVVLPSLPLMQQQGMGLDMSALLSLYSDYADMPELQDIVTYQGHPSGEEGSPPSEGPGKPSVTHRTNERVSRPGATRQGAEQVMVNQMLGGNSQQSEKEGAMRQMS